MTIVAINLKCKLEAGENVRPDSITYPSPHNKVIEEDSLCRVWVEDTAQRVAFKHWYKKQTNKKK